MIKCTRSIVLSRELLIENIFKIYYFLIKSTAFHRDDALRRTFLVSTSDNTRVGTERVVARSYTRDFGLQNKFIVFTYLLKALQRTQIIPVVESPYLAILKMSTFHDMYTLRLKDITSA